MTCPRWPALTGVHRWGPVPLGMHAPSHAGVAQMANKANGLPFTIADQESLEVCLCAALAVCAVSNTGSVHKIQCTTCVLCLYIAVYLCCSCATPLLPFAPRSKMFAAFCGLGIHNVMMYERIAKSMAKQKVALEVLSYHASASDEETEHMMVSVT